MRPALFIAMSRPLRSYQGPLPIAIDRVDRSRRGAEERLPRLAAGADIGRRTLADRIRASEATEVAAEAVLTTGLQAHRGEARHEEAEVSAETCASAEPEPDPEPEPLPWASGSTEPPSLPHAASAKAITSDGRTTVNLLLGPGRVANVTSDCSDAVAVEPLVLDSRKTVHSRAVAALTARGISRRRAREFAAYPVGLRCACACYCGLFQVPEWGPTLQFISETTRDIEDTRQQHGAVRVRSCRSNRLLQPLCSRRRRRRCVADRDCERRSPRTTQASAGGVHRVRERQAR